MTASSTTALPHERDQDPATQDTKSRPVMKQAYKDMQSGQQDTDRRHATDRITDPQVNADAPGNAAAVKKPR